MRLVAGRRLLGLTVVLDGVHDPHNISAVLRSAEGFGIQHVHAIGAARDVPVNRAITRRCEKWLSLHYHATAATCAAALRADGFELWSAVPERDAKRLTEIDFSRKIALVFGAERDGVSDELRAVCNGTYVIAMAGFSESLNVSVAAAISMMVGSSRRRAALGRPTDLTHEAVEALAVRWIEADTARGNVRGPAAAP